MKREDLENPEKLKQIINEINSAPHPCEKVIAKQKELGKKLLILMFPDGEERIIIEDSDSVIVITDHPETSKVIGFNEIMAMPASPKCSCACHTEDGPEHPDQYGCCDEAKFKK